MGTIRDAGAKKSPRACAEGPGEGGSVLKVDNNRERFVQFFRKIVPDCLFQTLPGIELVSYILHVAFIEDVCSICSAHALSSKALGPAFALAP